MPDILDEIIQRRREDYRALGPTFGSAIPKNRERPSYHFLAEPGVVLEIKRASPSKGAIAVDLDPVALAKVYAQAGAKQVSILTERHYFKGSLDDLVAVGRSGIPVALLRKDFIQFAEEIDISYRAGADAVLLIARMLESRQLRQLASLCRDRNMVPFVEVRERGDIAKLLAVCTDGPVVAGVNSRDLRTFLIDPLVPAALRGQLPCKAVFESGATTAGQCRYARSLGYEGLLLGEAAAREPSQASGFVEAFTRADANRNGKFWREIGERAKARNRPLVKICGITTIVDAELATRLGADALGFVFAKSVRAADCSLVERFHASLEVPVDAKRPLFIGVVTSMEDALGQQALSLAKRGLLDAIQYHGELPVQALAMLDEYFEGGGVGRYAAIGIAAETDFTLEHDLYLVGEPRVLCDARSGAQAGGTGRRIDGGVLGQRKAERPLWLAGGLGPETIGDAINRFHPELIDASSRLEASPGIKDPQKLQRFFEEVDR